MEVPFYLHDLGSSQLWDAVSCCQLVIACAHLSQICVWGLQVGNTQSTMDSSIYTIKMGKYYKSEPFKALPYKDTTGFKTVGMKCQLTGMAEVLSTQMVWIWEHGCMIRLSSYTGVLGKGQECYPLCLSQCFWVDRCSVCLLPWRLLMTQLLFLFEI